MALGDGGGVHGEDPQLEAADLLLHPLRQLPPALFGRPGAVEQQGGAGGGLGQQIELAQEVPVVAGHQLGALDQIGRPDRPLADAQMRDGGGAGFLRVVDEVGLAVQACGLTDDPDRVLVGADGAIGAQAVEQRLKALSPALPCGVAAGQLPGGIHRQGAVGHVVVDAHREMVAGRLGREVVEHRLHHRRCELLGGQAVAAAHHLRQQAGMAQMRLPVLSDGRHHIELERFGGAARLLAAIENGDAAGAGG